MYQEYTSVTTILEDLVSALEHSVEDIVLNKLINLSHNRINLDEYLKLQI